MSAPQKRKIQKAPVPRSDFGVLILKQVLASAVCFMFVLGMKNCGNAKFSDYAAALGRALRYNSQWETIAEDTASWLADKFSAEPELPEADDSVTFH